MNAVQKELSEEDYQEMLTEIYGTVKFGHLEFDAGRIIRKLDPTDFRCRMADEPEIWICGECDTEYGSEEEAQECCKEEDE